MPSKLIVIAEPGFNMKVLAGIVIAEPGFNMKVLASKAAPDGRSYKGNDDDYQYDDECDTFTNSAIFLLEARGITPA